MLQQFRQERCAGKAVGNAVVLRQIVAHIVRKHCSGGIDGHTAQNRCLIQSLSLLQRRLLLRSHLCHLPEHREPEADTLYRKQAGEGVCLFAEIALDAMADRVDPGGERRGPRQRHRIARIPHRERRIDPPVMDAVLLSGGVGQDRDRRDLAAGSRRRTDQHDGQRRMVPFCGIEDLLRHPRIRRENADGFRRVQRGAPADSEHKLRPR